MMPHLPLPCFASNPHPFGTPPWAQWMAHVWHQLLAHTPAPQRYTTLVEARTAFNKAMEALDLPAHKGFVCVLEDAWNEATEGETHIEYSLRSLATKAETPPFAADVYHNRKDAHGVWHLEAYQHSVLLPSLAQWPQALAQFLQEHA